MLENDQSTELQKMAKGFVWNRGVFILGGVINSQDTG